jgi:hypothetical protein
MFDDLDDTGFERTSEDLTEEILAHAPKYFAFEPLSVDPIEWQKHRVDDLVRTYRDTRDQLTVDRRAYDAREAELKTLMVRISMVLRDRADDLGVESFRTEHGTAYRNVKESFRVSGWDSLVDYVKQTGNFHILQHRVSAVAVREIRKVDGDIPPGLDHITEIEFAVRSPTARKSK